MQKTFLLLSLSALLSLPSLAQQNDSIYYKNNLKVNASAPLLWGYQNIVVEYERVIQANRSFSVSLGYRSFPKLLGVGKADSAMLVRDHKNLGGLSATIDYRFYPAKENRYAAPRGVYISPYINYFGNNIRNNVSTFYSEAVDLTITTHLHTLNAGVSLGYQFVFNERITLDLSLIGPSVTYYNVQFQVSGEGDSGKTRIVQDFISVLEENYPIIDVATQTITFSNSERISKVFFGYRYLFKVGYLF